MRVLACVGGISCAGICTLHLLFCCLLSTSWNDGQKYFSFNKKIIIIILFCLEFSCNWGVNRTSSGKLMG